MFSLIYFKRENTKNIKQRERGNPPRPANCFLPIWEENLEENRRKDGLTSWITHLPPQKLTSYTSSLFKKFIYLWEVVCSYFLFFCFFFFLLILSSMFFFLFFCAHTFFSQLFWFFYFYLFIYFLSFGFLNFLSSFYFLFFKEVIIQT